MPRYCELDYSPTGYLASDNIVAGEDHAVVCGGEFNEVILATAKVFTAAAWFSSMAPAMSSTRIRMCVVL